MIIDNFTNSIFGMAFNSAFIPSLITFVFGMFFKYDDTERKKLLVKFWVCGFLTVTLCVTGCIKYYIFEYGTLHFNELINYYGFNRNEYVSDNFILFVVAPIFFTYLTLQLLDKYKKQLKLV